MKIVGVVVVVVLVLFGLYWGGRFLLPQSSPTALREQGARQSVLIEELPPCPEGSVYTDLEQALAVTASDEVAVCGLDLSGQRVLWLTKGITFMAGLTWLDVSETNLRELPEWLGELNNFTQLQVLDLRGTPTTEVEVENARRQLPQTTILF